MRIYNTLTRKKEDFVPLEQNKIKMYVCGPTVYNYIHIGNARPYVVFDTFRRYMEYQGYEVNYVQNFTDVDDKIINRANEEQVPMGEISERYIAETLKDADSLYIKRATHHPKVTEEIDSIVEMISTLIAKGFAYEKNGTVYFDTHNYQQYGKLSRRNLEELESGVRIEVDSEKKNPSDFVLWKPKKEGEPSWPSPWSDGRPGWHIECSVMAKKYLGDTIDIHAGGEDLVFPHHENEIAQSEAANGAPFARYWMHNGFINVDNEKMSKSKGNFFTLREIAESFPYEVIRFFILTGHYRSPLNFSQELMTAAKTSLERIKTCLGNVQFLIENNTNQAITPEESQLIENSAQFKENFIKSMEDDLNTADAIAAIFDFVRYINSNTDEDSSVPYLQKLYEKIKQLCDILGICADSADETADGDAEEIESLIAQRTQAKKDKDFKKADAIRDQLTDMGVTIEDTRQGVRWYRNH